MEVSAQFLQGGVVHGQMAHCGVGGGAVLALQWLRAEAFTHLLPSEEATCFGGRIGVCIWD